MSSGAVSPPLADPWAPRALPPPVPAPITAPTSSLQRDPWLPLAQVNMKTFMYVCICITSVQSILIRFTESVASVEHFIESVVRFGRL